MRLTACCPRRLAGLVLASLFVFGSEATAVVFDDGGVHLIDRGHSFPAEAVVVADGPGGAATTVRIENGSQVATAACAGAGFCKALTISGASLVEIRGGDVGGLVEVEDDAKLSISGGRIDSVRTRNRASVEISAGTLGRLHVRDGRSVLITGAEIHEFFAEGLRTSAWITDGEFFSFSVDSASRVTILGGSFYDGVGAGESAQVVITGGTFAGALVVSDRAKLSVLGTAFNFPFGELKVALAGRLTGELADGTNLEVDFRRDASATLALVFSGLIFADADGDGEHNVTDHCPGTAADADVDSIGCSREQFCAAVDVGAPDGIAECRLGDWKNDEATEDARDCRVLRVGLADFLCVPTPGAD